MMTGTDITSPADKLVKVTEEHIYNSLVSPKPHIANLISQLRTVYTIDLKRYAAIKKQLPYIVCGMFNPPYRNSNNFAYTETFILDFDHLGSKGLKVDDIRQKFIRDDRVLMCFSSPSEDGIKAIFRLKERCYDKGIYSLFYKAFAKKLAAEYGLEQVIDSSTSDVSRACFVSVDPKAWYNPLAEDIDLNAYVDINNPAEVADLRREQKAAEAKAAAEKDKAEKDPSSKEPPQDVMAAIRQKLNPKASLPSKPAYVPEVLKRIMPALKEYIELTGICVDEVIDIQYGKKIRASMGTKQAELNLFYGQRGYKPVISPRRGTDSEANELLQLAVINFLSDNDL